MRAPQRVERKAELAPIGASENGAGIDTLSQADSNKTQSPPCLASAAEVRKLTPHAWPKWTYGPNGERCWYSGEKPVFAKAPNEQAFRSLNGLPNGEDQSSRRPRSAEPLKCRWCLPT
jgi:hypothetical protein